MGSQTYLIAAIFVNYISTSTAIVAYDCGGHGLNVTSLSLLDIGGCSVPDIEPKKEEKYVQLLQLSEFDNVAVIQCKVEIDRTIYYCGMQSHNSIVHNGRREYLLDISSQLCKQMHTTGMLTLGDSTQITGLRVNNTESRSLTLAGIVGTDGTCKGTQFSDPYGTWDGVVVQATVKITLRSYIAPAKLPTNQILLHSGVHCMASEGQCLDSDGGFTFWTIIPEDSCHFSHYDILYEGLVAKLGPKSDQPGPTIYTVTTQETTFALTKTTEFSLCGYTLLKTEHPKLFIMETEKGKTFSIRGKTSVNNLDIFSYVNSKFIYVEKHLKTQLTQLYTDIIQQKCVLEQQVLRNALTLAAIAPDEAAHLLMKGPGYMSTVAGEVLHIIKCVPVNVQLRRTEQCYKELPVSHQNVSMFITPKSRIITRRGTTRECSELLPPMFKIHNTWFKLMPQPVESLEPPVMKPLTSSNWKYTSPEHLATSGIYSSGELEKLRDHIMFPLERPSMLNTIARGAMGHSIPVGSIQLSNLLDEKSLEKIAETASYKLWKWFVTFGSASAGLIGIYFIIRTLKMIIDTIINGYALHSIYGWSIYIMGAVWNSVTQLLLHLGRYPNPVQQAVLPPVDTEDSHHTKVTNTEDSAGTDRAGESSLSNVRYAELSRRLAETYP